MTGVLVDWLVAGALGAGLVLCLFLVLRIVSTRGAPALQPWHIHVPDELQDEAMDRLDWDGYVAAEGRLFDAVEGEIAARLPPHDQVPINRFFTGSPVHPRGLERDWNRSFLLEPMRPSHGGPPQGAAVLLHGLTDSPYSLRHLAAAYQAQGWLAVVVRLPGHGTVPAGLARIGWQSWAAAVRLAVREARRRLGETAPLHLVGYSNGGALALDHALRALDEPAIGQPTRLVLLSPMVGVTWAARFAGIAGWPAVVPRWARTAWIKIVPEYNPFKYASLPVNAARQSHLLTRDLQRRLNRLAKTGRLGEVPPILTFQSVVDATVLVDAVIRGLHARLPRGSSELVLFDINRAVHFGHLLRPAAARPAMSLLPPAPRDFAVAVLTNRAPSTSAVIERSVAAGATEARDRPLDLAFPPGVYSLSHVALPFPLDDSLYGLSPDPPEAFGISLGAMATRGERDVLAVSGDDLTRLAANPFFPYLIERLEAAMRADVERG
jgi:alpha-beta hydrolase superfamily lysophospholipase